MSDFDVSITAVFTDAEAAALTRLCKYMGFSQCRAIADSKEEARLMRHACDVLAKLLDQARHTLR